MSGHISSLPFLSDRGNETYKLLLQEELETEAVRRELDSQATWFTLLDTIWLRRVTASIDGDMNSKLIALEQMIDSDDGVMVQLAHAELIAMRSKKARSILKRRGLLTDVEFIGGFNTR